MSRRRPWPLIAPPLLLALAAIAPARAGSVTSQSTWSKGNAIERATQQLPRGATVTGTSCTEVNVGIGNYRYICSVEFSPAPVDPAPAAPAGQP